MVSNTIMTGDSIQNAETAFMPRSNKCYCGFIGDTVGFRLITQMPARIGGGWDSKGDSPERVGTNLPKLA